MTATYTNFLDVLGPSMVSVADGLSDKPNNVVFFDRQARNAQKTIHSALAPAHSIEKPTPTIAQMQENGMVDNRAPLSVAELESAMQSTTAKTCEVQLQNPWRPLPSGPSR